MRYRIVRSDAKIDDLMNECFEAEEQGTTKFRGMSFEEGIRHAISWLTDAEAPHPLEDD